jgi:iron complex outermembrane receptor protein
MRRLALSLVLLAAVAPAATGQEPPHDEEAPPRVKSDVAIVATRLGASDPSSTVRVVTRDEIEHFPGRSLSELLQWVTGIDARRRGVEGIQADVSLRGADYNGTLILVDGEPVNDPQTNHHSADLDVPLDGVERVEILYGAGAAVWGSNAVGGVVNVVTRGANLGRARAQLHGRLLHGSNSLDAGGLRVASKIGDRLAVAADWSRSETSGFRDDTESSQDAVRGSARWETGAGPLSASFGYARRRFGAFAFYGTTIPNQQETTAVRTAAVQATLSLGEWTLTPSVSWRAHHDDFVLDRSNPSLYENLSDTTRLDGRLVARRSLLGGTAVAGLEAGGDSIDSTKLGEHSRRRAAFFLEYGRPFRESDPAAGGFRVGLRGDDDEDFGSHLSPHAGVYVAVAPRLTLRASAGTAFRVPTYTELYYRDPQNVGNPSLAPEKATNVEAGATYAAGAFAFDVAGFYRHGTDLIDFVRSSPGAPFTARNIRAADTSGVEATAAWHGSRGALLSRASLSAAYLFSDLTVLSEAAGGATEGKYLLDPLHVKWDLVLGGTLPLSVAALTRVSYFARPSYASGVWLWDLRLGRDLLQGEIAELYAEGRNLTDTRYEEVPGVPLPGRTFVFGLRVTW